MRTGSYKMPKSRNVSKLRARRPMLVTLAWNHRKTGYTDLLELPISQNGICCRKVRPNVSKILIAIQRKDSLEMLSVLIPCGNTDRRISSTKSINKYSFYKYIYPIVLFTTHVNSLSSFYDILAPFLSIKNLHQPSEFQQFPFIQTLSIMVIHQFQNLSHRLRRISHSSQRQQPNDNHRDAIP